LQGKLTSHNQNQSASTRQKARLGTQKKGKKRDQDRYTGKDKTETKITPTTSKLTTRSHSIRGLGGEPTREHLKQPKPWGVVIRGPESQSARKREKAAR